MTEKQLPPETDAGLRWMFKWVFVAFVLVVLLALLVVELTMRWFGAHSG